MAHRRDKDDFNRIREMQETLRRLDADPSHFVPRRFGYPSNIPRRIMWRSWTVIFALVVIVALGWEGR